TLLMLFVYMSFSLWRRRVTLKEMGIRGDTFWPAAKSMGLLAGLLIVLLLATGTILGRSPWSRKFVLMLLGYVPWGTFQQFLLQSYLCVRLRAAFSEDFTPAVWSAFFFGVVHLPNPYLVVASFAFGVIGCLHFLKYRNLWVLGLAHALLGSFIYHCFPAEIVGGFNTAEGYLKHFAPLFIGPGR
ncbi:MAG TPA: CPBP family intramembrane metalloprotease, partial [Armatimonadetes bacterium]|nr:CPBP family intramembrane metalloprotease [Armatimonadota bacterium]